MYYGIKRGHIRFDTWPIHTHTHKHTQKPLSRFFAFVLYFWMNTVIPVTKILAYFSSE